MSEAQAPQADNENDLAMGRVITQSLGNSGLDWNTLFSQVQGHSPLCSDTHLMCPRCQYKENFNPGAGPVEFRTWAFVSKYAAFMVRIYRCPRDGCKHYFAPIGSGRFNAWHANQNRESK